MRQVGYSRAESCDALAGMLEIRVLADNRFGVRANRSTANAIRAVLDVTEGALKRRYKTDIFIY